MIASRLTFSMRNLCFYSDLTVAEIDVCPRIIRQNPSNQSVVVSSEPPSESTRKSSLLLVVLSITIKFVWPKPFPWMFSWIRTFGVCNIAAAQAFGSLRRAGGNIRPISLVSNKFRNSERNTMLLIETVRINGLRACTRSNRAYHEGVANSVTEQRWRSPTLRKEHHRNGSRMPTW